MLPQLQAHNDATLEQHCDLWEQTHGERVLKGSIILSLYNKEGEFRQEQVLFCSSDYLLEIYLFPFR